MDVPSVCTIVKAIEWVGRAYRQRNSVAGSSRQSRNNTQKCTRKMSANTRYSNCWTSCSNC